MKILMLIDSLVKGGRERRLIELLKGFQHYEDLEVSLVIFSNRVEYPEVYDLNIPIHFLERKPKKDPRVFFKFYSICKKEQPDIIHSWGTMPSIYAIPAVRMMGIKFINASIADAPEKNYLDKYYLRLKFIYPHCNAVIGNSQAGLNAYDAPKNKSFCFHNGFDFNRVSNLENPALIRKKYKIQPGLVAGMVGGFFNRKDYQTYIKTAVKYLEQRTDMTFLAIGDGPERAKCEALVPDRFKDRILFPGMVHEVESLVNVFDIGVLSSYREGISNSIMEYMVLGKPVIATDAGGTNELVVNEETGYLIEVGDGEALLERLFLLADDADLRSTLGENGKERIHTHFTLDRMEKEYFRLYQNLLSGPTAIAS